VSSQSLSAASRDVVGREDDAEKVKIKVTTRKEEEEEEEEETHLKLHFQTRVLNRGK